MNRARREQVVKNHGEEKSSGAVASVVFAAGKGSRMVGFDGNKTLLPLVPGSSIHEGEVPILVEVLRNLPPGPKGIVVHHRADQVRETVAGEGTSFIEQPVLNGTGGALLAASGFLESVEADTVVITMGDVPLLRASTYRKLLARLETDACDLALLAFEPRDKARYGVLEMDGDRVLRVVEWKYWKDFPPGRQAELRYCNAGVYAAGRRVLLRYLDLLARRPHTVEKQWGSEIRTFDEYFITDLVELASGDGRAVGVVVAPETEVAGVDTPEALQRVQLEYARK